jgi:hypothetical protein
MSGGAPAHAAIAGTAEAVTTAPAAVARPAKADIGEYIKRDIVLRVWKVLYHPDAEAERGKLPDTEKAALLHAVEKLKVLGPALRHPHSSAVKGADRLRELRLRAGNSPWRALYRQVQQAFVIAAVCPEAKNNPKGFKRGCADAEKRLAEMEESS